MALKRKNLMVDAEQLAALAEWRGTTESATVREVVANALLAEEFVAAMEALRATGYGADRLQADYDTVTGDNVGIAGHATTTLPIGRPVPDAN